MSRVPAFGAQALQALGIVSALVLTTVLNVLAARHFTRWDWTQDRRWSLSPATMETLRTLERPVDVWAIAGPGDPLEQSLRQLLTAYGAASSRISAHWIDPDRDGVQWADLQRRYGLQAGRTEDGRVAADAIVVLASGDRHWFLTPSDMVEPSDDVHVKPREERALTQGIRSVLGGTAAKLCFTVGHGELSLEPGKDESEWLGSVRDLLQKSNYELASVDTTAPNAHEPFAGCTVVVVAGPSVPFAPEETNRLRTWLLEGGSLFAAVGPIEADSPTGMTGAGLSEALSPFGIALDENLVHDVDPRVAIPDTHGEGFFVSARPHAVTASLVSTGPDSHPPRIAAFYAQSLSHVTSRGAPFAADLLVTGEEAFAKQSIIGAASWTDAPPREPKDRAGPFVLAMAGQYPHDTAGGGRGPRVVVIGSRFALAEENWRQARALHGMAFFVDSAISWLAARPTVIDIPERADVAAGLRISEQGRMEVRRYVLVLMPLAAVLLGAAVWAWRRSSENQPYERRSSP